MAGPCGCRRGRCSQGRKRPAPLRSAPSGDRAAFEGIEAVRARTRQEAFILGTIRILLVVPRLGETIAVIFEAPVILAASWFVCRWCVKRFNVTRTVPARSLMGLVAFLVLISAEFALGAVLGRSLADQLAAYKSPPGAIGLGAQMIFAMFPVIQVLRRFGEA